MNKSDNIIVSVKDIYKSFKNVNALNGIDLEIRSNEYVALLGPNGAGKTTLVEIIEGIQKPSKGSVSLFGKSWHNNKSELYQKIGLSFQETKFEDKLTTRETVKMFASFYNVHYKNVDEILSLVNLTDKQNSWVVNLSGGQRQKLALAIALINNPQLLILDEPTTGLDPTARREIWTILQSLKQKHGTSMILTTHYMEEAEKLCDKIVIIDNGKILTQGTLNKLISISGISEIIEFNYLEYNQLPKLDFKEIVNVEVNAELKFVKLSVINTSEVLPKIITKLNSVACKIINLRCRNITLDDVFINMTGRKLTD